MLPFIMTESGFQTLIENKSYAVNKNHPHFEELFVAIQDEAIDLFLTLFTKASAITHKFADTGVVVDNGTVFYNGEELHGTLIDRIIDFTEIDIDTQPMINFLNNLMQNPSSRAIRELYNFLEHRALPITSDGCFIAYKTVRPDYKDKYSGKIDNSVGQVVEFPRNQVDDDNSRTCSAGLHVGALEYAGPGGWYNSHGDKVMIVKINPADAVAVPADHDAQKLRVCKYEVIDEYEQPLDASPVYEIDVNGLEEVHEDDFHELEDEDNDNDLDDNFDWD